MPDNATIQLPQSITAWGSPAFKDVLKQEILQLGTTQLPLQQGMSYGNYVSDNNLTVMILSVNEDGAAIHVKAGIMFTGVIGGCHCADDPSPNNEHPEYCELMLKINKTNATTSIQLLEEE